MNNRRVGRRVSVRALAIGGAGVALAMSAPVAASAAAPPTQPQQEERVVFRCEQVRPELPTQVIGERCEPHERGPLFQPFVIAERRHHHVLRAFECRQGYSDSPVFVEGRYCHHIRWVEPPQHS